jgi:hypothetical protein
LVCKWLGMWGHYFGFWGGGLTNFPHLGDERKKWWIQVGAVEPD